MKFNGGYCLVIAILIACNDPQKNFQSISQDTVGATPGYTVNGQPIGHINTGKTTPVELLTYALSLTGTPIYMDQPILKKGLTARDLLPMCLITLV